MIMLYFYGEYHEYHHYAFERNGWYAYNKFKCNESVWMVPCTIDWDYQ